MIRVHCFRVLNNDCQKHGTEPRRVEMSTSQPVYLTPLLYLSFFIFNLKSYDFVKLSKLIFVFDVIRRYMALDYTEFGRFL